MAEPIAAFSERRFSLAIKPAGSSPPRLIRRPVLRRSRLPTSPLFCPASTRWASNDETFVLIRLIVSSLNTPQPRGCGLDIPLLTDRNPPESAGRTERPAKHSWLSQPFLAQLNAEAFVAGSAE